MKKLLLLLPLLILGYYSFSQSDKEIKQNKIKTITTWQSEKENPSSSYKESVETYDKFGILIQRIKYKKDGSVDSKETFKYDKFQNKIEEFEYDGNNAVVKHKVYVYNSFQKKTEEREYTPTGEISSRTVITYNPNGDKESETLIDSKGALVKQVEYKYNAKKLKTQRTSSNKAKQLESVKKWSYEYY